MDTQTPAPVWTMALHGTACTACQQPALGIRVYPDGRRFVDHPRVPGMPRRWPCELTPAPTPPTVQP